MQDKKQIQENIEEDANFIRPFPLWAMMVCGIMLLLTGGYCIITNQVAAGSAVMLRHWYSTYNTPNPHLNGITILIFGVLMCIFPVYQLYKQRKRDK